MIKIPLPGVVMEVINHPDHFELSLLIVCESMRGQGLGTRAIRSLQQFERPIRLTAVPDKNKTRALHRFYRRLGFKYAGKDVAGGTCFQWTPGGAQ